MQARPARAPAIAALVAAAGLLAPGVTARPGAQAPAAQAPGDQPTFRAGVRLATFDAVVTDDKGRHVTDLTAADFEVVERGKRQTVRQAAYVPTTGPPAADRATRDNGAARRHAGSCRPRRTGAHGPRPGDRGRRPDVVTCRRRSTHAPDADALSRHDGGAGRSRRDPAGVRRKRRPAAVHERPPAARRGHRARTLGAASRLERRRSFSFHDEFLGDLEIDGVLGALEYAVRGVSATPRTEGRRVRVRAGRARSRPPSVTGDPAGAAERDHRPGQPRRRRHLPDRPGRPGHPAADGGGPPGRSPARRTRPAWCAMR